MRWAYNNNITKRYIKSTKLLHFLKKWTASIPYKDIGIDKNNRMKKSLLKKQTWARYLKGIYILISGYFRKSF